MTNRVAASLGSTALPLTTETALATVNANTGTTGYSVLIRAEVQVTGAASATTCTLQLRRGTAVTGASVGTSSAFQVPASAVTVPLVFSFIDTAPVAPNGLAQYVVTGNAAGAAQTAAASVIEVQVLNTTF